MAVKHADQLLRGNPQSYEALDSKGLALCGLALLRGDQHIVAAKRAYSAARAIFKEYGVVGRVLRLFDALSVADDSGALQDVRAVAAGETP